MLSDAIKKALAPLSLEKVEPGDYSKTGYHLEVAAKPEQMPAVAQAMLAQGCYLASLTALALAIVSREPWVDLFGHSEEGWVLFWKLLPLGVGMTLGGVSGVMSVVALVRDLALLLVIPAVLGLIIGMVGLGGVLIPQ